MVLMKSPLFLMYNEAVDSNKTLIAYMTGKPNNGEKLNVSEMFPLSAPTQNFDK